MAEFVYADDTKDVQKKAAQMLAKEIRRLHEKQERIVVAVPGGRSMAGLFSFLKEEDLDWGATHFFMVDERMVPIHDPESNYSILWEHLGKELTGNGLMPEENLHPFKCEDKSPQQAISEYEEELKQYGGSFDIVILSAGEDGHMAGLYPDHHSVRDDAEYFIHMDDSPKPPAERMSASRSLIEQSKVAIVMFAGEVKREALHRFMDDERVEPLPARLIKRVERGFVITDQSAAEGEEVYLCADIGGTHTNLSIVSQDLQVIDIDRASTQEISDFPEHVRSYTEAMEKRGYRIQHACFSIAGPLDSSRRKAKMTNAHLAIDAKDVETRAGLVQVRLINDFQAIALATNVIDEKRCRVLSDGNAYGNVRAVIGAGTGLGESIMYCDPAKGFIPLHSEGGHVNACPENEEELDLLRSLAKMQQRQHVMEYEDVVSGPGLARIYAYYSGGREMSPEEVSRCADETSRKAFETFVRFYARKAKALCLECYATGGLYIAGGIAANNPEKLEGFMEEFTRHDRFAGFLKDIPVTIMMDYDISHVGAAYALKFDVD